MMAAGLAAIVSPGLGMLITAYALVTAKDMVQKIILLITIASLLFTQTKRNSVLILISVLGMMMFLSSQNWLMLYFAWEIMSITSYLLINSSNEFNKQAARKVFTLNRISGLFMLGAVGMIYSQSMSFEFGVIPPTAALLMVIAGMIKSSQFPFFWLKYAARAPTPVSALIHSVTSVAVGPLLLNRFSINFIFLSGLIIPWALISIVAAAVLALGSENQKQVLSYSTIINLAFLFSLFNSEFFLAAFLVHALVKSAYFLLIESYSHDTNYALSLGFSPKSLEGLFSLFFIFSLSGAPLFGLYWFKMGDLSSAIITFLSLIYFFKLFKETFSGQMTPPRNWKTLIPMGLGMLSIAFYRLGVPRPESLVVFFGATVIAYKIFPLNAVSVLGDHVRRLKEWTFGEISPPERYLEEWAHGVGKRTNQLSEGINHTFSGDIRRDVSYIAAGLAVLLMGVII